jgi:hypothetical protein
MSPLSAASIADFASSRLIDSCATHPRAAKRGTCLPDVPFPLPRRIETRNSSVPNRAPRRPSPLSRRVGIHVLHFRGLLRTHSRYGPSVRSPTQGGLRSRLREVSRPSPRLRCCRGVRITPRVRLSLTDTPRLSVAHYRSLLIRSARPIGCSHGAGLRSMRRRRPPVP